MSKGLLKDSRFVEFLDYFSLFSTSKFGDHIREGITTRIFERAPRPDHSSSGLGQASYLLICGKELGCPPYRSGESPSFNERVLQSKIGLKELKHLRHMNPLTVFKAFENWDIENL